MMSSFPYKINLVLSIILLLFVLVGQRGKRAQAILQRRRRKGGLGSGFTRGVMVAAILAGIVASAASSATGSLQRGEWIPQGAKALGWALPVVAELCLQGAFFLFVLEMICFAGMETLVRRRWVFLALPFLAFGVCTALWPALSGRVGDDWMISRLMSGSGPANLLSFIYVLFLFFFLLRHETSLLPVLLLHALLKGLFSDTLWGHDVVGSELILILTLTQWYLYLTERNRSLLVQAGVVSMLILLQTTRWFGDGLVASAFSSYLRTVRELGRDDMEEVLEELSATEALPWITSYVIARREEIREALDEELFGKAGPVRQSSIAEDEEREKTAVRTLEGYAPEDQERFVLSWMIDLWSDMNSIIMKNGLEELLLIIPDESGVYHVLLDVGRNRHEPGDRADMERLEREEGLFDKISANLTNQLRTLEDGEMLVFRQESPYTGAASPIRLYGGVSRSVMDSHIPYVTDIQMSATFHIISEEIFLMFILYLMALKPLARVKRSVVDYQVHKDADRAVRDLDRLHSRNEAGTLAEEFSNLAEEMEHYTEETARLAGEKERIDTELRLATAIQSDLLPRSFPASPAYELHAAIYPAREMSGDFYDAFLVDGEHLVLAIADVAGKGIPASLFMTVTRTLIRSAFGETISPGEALARVNDQVCESNNAEMFVTVWLAVLEISTGRLVSVNAGHEDPIIRRAGGRFEADFYSHSVVLGILPGASFEERETILGPGDTIFVYTDGVPEAQDLKEEMFGMERLLEILNKEPEDGPERLLARVREAVSDFVGGNPPSDDLTMMALRMRRDGEVQNDEG